MAGISNRELFQIKIFKAVSREMIAWLHIINNTTLQMLLEVKNDKFSQKHSLFPLFSSFLSEMFTQKNFFGEKNLNKSCVKAEKNNKNTKK